MLTTEMKEWIKDNTNYLEDLFYDYYSNNIEEAQQDYILDKISELADSNVDIYNHNLLKWLWDNYSDYEDYIEEFGINSNWFNLMQTIQGAQFIQIEREILEELGDFETEFVLSFDY